MVPSIAHPQCSPNPIRALKSGTLARILSSIEYFTNFDESSTAIKIFTNESTAKSAV
jgi:hypothetical protein